MKTSEILMLTLLRNMVVKKEAITDVVTQETLSDLLTLSAKHSITPLVAEGLFSCGLLKEEDIAEVYRQLSYKALVRGQKQELELCKITDFFEKNHIKNIPLKGAILRNFYPEPWLRTSCDIDILIHEEELKRVVGLLQTELGYKKENVTNHDVLMVAPNGVNLELHYDIEEAGLTLSEIWKTAVLTHGEFQYTLSPELFILHHVGHMSKHFVLGGCGIRSLLDLWLIEKNIPYDHEVFKQKLIENNLLTFYEKISKLLSAWMTGNAFTDFELQLTKFIFSGGVYGNLDNRLSVGQSRREGLFYFVFRRIVPPKRSMIYLYPVLKKHPFLLPIYHIRRWFSLLRLKKIKKASEEIQIINSLNDDSLSETKNILLELGL